MQTIHTGACAKPYTCLLGSYAKLPSVQCWFPRWFKSFDALHTQCHMCLLTQSVWKTCFCAPDMTTRILYYSVHNDLPR